jgi:hypothetical protein
VNKVLVRKSQGKIPLGKPMHKWKDNIKTDFKEMGWEDEDWIHLA